MLINRFFPEGNKVLSNRLNESVSCGGGGGGGGGGGRFPCERGGDNCRKIVIKPYGRPIWM